MPGDTFLQIEGHCEAIVADFVALSEFGHDIEFQIVVEQTLVDFRRDQSNRA